MKSKIFTLSLLLIAFLGLNLKSAKAQYVTIPDANFRTYLITHYPMCMNGNQMDTTCSEIVNAINMYIGGSAQIANFTGLQYFDNLQLFSYENVGNLTSLPNLPKKLKSFTCINSQLTSISYLPDSLVYFNCNGNQLSTLPPLPSTLIEMQCQGNVLTSLPPLPNGLKYIYCQTNQLTSLPALPDSLLIMYCTSSQLTSLPQLPSKIFKLYCQYNQIVTIPTLPESLIELMCQNNSITSLSNLPTNLEKFYCATNQISSMPNLPNSLKDFRCDANLLDSLPPLPNSIITLSCSNNNLTSLPTLPNSLEVLFCGDNQLSQLPNLPATIKKLQIQNNNLVCLPLLPYITNSSFYYLDISGNSFTCVPNYVPAMDSATFALPLCEPNDTIHNANNCSAATGILGSIYRDSNNNCEMNDTDFKIKNIKVKFFNPLTNQFGVAYSALDGIFNYPANSGTYLINVDTLDQSYQANCLYPGIDTTVITTIANPLVRNVNLDISCKSGIDLKVQSIAHNNGLVFPGQQHTLQVMVGDASQWYGLNCTSGMSGQVQITVTGPIIYNGAAAGSLTPTINGNIYTYEILDFGEINNAKDFKLLFTTNTTAQAGNQICVHVEITPIIDDILVINNSRDYCYNIHNSNDPNYKEVYPTEVVPGFEDWLTYTIHFQNTGNAPAINIRLLDTLDTNLNAETFEVINYSHYNTVTLMDGIIDFRFPNILLPDSTSDLAGSQGFVQYRIKPMANLPLGTQIENTANIYFDYNAPITTNTTLNSFTYGVGLKDNLKLDNISIYPNPSQGVFNLSTTANIEVYNVVGELILQNRNARTIDLSNNPNGIYFIKLNGITTKKLIKN